jgi:cytochrome P450
MDAQAVTQALLTPDGRADPYPLYAEAHRLGPVSAISDGWYLVPGYAAASQLLRNPAFGPPGPQARTPGQPERPALALMSLSVLESSPPGHGRMRSVLSSSFTPRRVAALEPAITSAVDTLLGRLAGAGEPADFMEEFAYLLPVTVICELLGVPHADRDWFRPLARDLTAALEPLAGTPALDAADTAAGELAAYFTRLIAGRRAAPRDDLISALITASDAADAPLSPPELLANLILLLVAGFETTTDLLGNGTAILLDQPQAAAALRSGTVTTAGFADEVLRYESPVQLTTRMALAGDLAIHGTPVPCGSQAIVLLGAANRDPARYRRPDTFDPARKDSKPLSFGAGAHFCLGNSLARLEAAIAFPRILARFPRLAAAPSGRTRRDRIALRGYHTLPVITGI